MSESFGKCNVRKRPRTSARHAKKTRLSEEVKAEANLAEQRLVESWPTLVVSCPTLRPAGLGMGVPWPCADRGGRCGFCGVILLPSQLEPEGLCELHMDVDSEPEWPFDAPYSGLEPSPTGPEPAPPDPALPAQAPTLLHEPNIAKSQQQVGEGLSAAKQVTPLIESTLVQVGEGLSAAKQVAPSIESTSKQVDEGLNVAKQVAP